MNTLNRDEKKNVELEGKKERKLKIKQLQVKVIENIFNKTKKLHAAPWHQIQCIFSSFSIRFAVVVLFSLILSTSRSFCLCALRQEEITFASVSSQKITIYFVDSYSVCECA